jgi:hypothetical protein
MSKLITAELIILIHFGFILFVIFGGLLALKWKKLILLHLPAAVWGVLIEFSGWICPLTTLENQLYQIKGAETYSTGFIAHYIIPVIYPQQLTQNIQIILGILLIFFNLVIYTLFFKKWISKSAKNTNF